ncbi:MAG: serine protease, partial [Oscillatoriales cyanobacterium SM2_1_8]|nr:serine protease [Oscillatoriales cyanobacterium SM2_1_8]
RTSANQTYSGRVVAVDRVNDLALIRLQTNGDRLPFVRLADPAAVEVGRRAYAIGSPFGLAGTLTTGILSGLPQRRLADRCGPQPRQFGGPSSIPTAN